MARPVIALLTDFGLRDHYVAAMKGVILGICPDATLVDISHDVPPQDVLAGAMELESVAWYLPAGTVVVGVVDPGVGSSRRGVAIEAGGLRFVGPDNGLFSLGVRQSGASRAYALENRRFARTSISRTFEGRDRFAPAAAWLATGVDIVEMGPAIDDLVALEIPEATATPTHVDGVVLRVDRFGNLITNIRESDVAAVGDASIEVAGARIDRVTLTYADVADGALCGLIGSTGRLEIAVNRGSAAVVLGAAHGMPVHVRRRSGA